MVDGFRRWLCELLGDLSDEEKDSMEVDPYTADAYCDDLTRVTEDRAPKGEPLGRPSDAHLWVASAALPDRGERRTEVRHDAFPPDKARSSLLVGSSQAFVI